MRWMELFEAIFLAGLYEDFKAKAHAKKEIFTVSRGKFVRDISTMLDFRLAHQNNGVVVRQKPRPPKIEIVSG